MGNSIVPSGGQNSYILAGKRKQSETYNTRVALWHLPYRNEYLQYDDDESRWFESANKWGENELEKAEQELKLSFERYKVRTKTTQYNDATYDVESKYPNKNTVVEKHGKNHVFIWIKDKFNQIIAEKIFNNESSDGRKTVYKNIKKGNDVLTIVEVYSYDTTKNRATDVVNYAYTSLLSPFTKGCKLQKEYYMLNGQSVQATKTDAGGYEVISKDGKILTFLVE